MALNDPTAIVTGQISRFVRNSPLLQNEPHVKTIVLIDKSAKHFSTGIYFEQTLRCLAMEKITVGTFIERWQGVTASELATAQSFVMDLCELLDVPKPHPTLEQDYMFERPVTFAHGDGSTSSGRIDCYRRGHFVLEAKKQRAGQHTKGFDDGLLRARTQGEGYARALPAIEGRPPFVLVIDVGTVLEVYAEFSRSGGTYVPFPDPRSHRIALADLDQPEILERLRLIWTNPAALDPALISAKVTREVSRQLATLARSLEQDGHPSHDVAAYLSRCLFSMFAEDVELLPAGSFLELLIKHRLDTATLRRMLASLWADMDRGGFSPAIVKEVLKFNGKLFKGATADAYSLLLSTDQVDNLIAAARAYWREVEPAIFGTLLERALDPAERHALGAHYTPRAYVERLVLPTVIEPLRTEWADVQVAALTLAHEAADLEAHPPEVNVKTKKGIEAIYRHNSDVRAKWKEAREQVHAFLHRLSTVRVLDPACGSGNFLYVTLEHLKRLEGEVLNQLDALGDTQDSLDLGRETVTVQQLLGIELNGRAAALAELVLWIGFLQWQIRTRGRASVVEPVVHNYGNIEHRDAVLAYDSREPLLDEAGLPVTCWDGITTKAHSVTGQPVPDDTAQVMQWRYENPRQAEWPPAEFIVGNPPFIGNKRMRTTLGGGYVDALRTAWNDVPESVDFVMYWWNKAAETVRTGAAERFGFITTNSLTMIFNRQVVAAQQGATPPLSLVFAVPDHPWVDSASGAAVRIAMSVGVPGRIDGDLYTITSEVQQPDGESTVIFKSSRGIIHSDLKVGANVASAKILRANEFLSNRGLIPHGAGFTITVEQARLLGLGAQPKLERRIRPYRNNKDLTGISRNQLIIDTFDLTTDQLRTQFPQVFQWLLERVKPERDQNRDRAIREKWWLHARSRGEFRPALDSIPRFIATGQVSKHRTFQWLDSNILPDDKLIAIASADALHLGVLSSRVHVSWALASGGLLEDRPVYSKSTCFEPFPFPSDDTCLTPVLADRIRSLAEQIDAHRKSRQAEHAGLTITGLYNVMEKLRSGDSLTAKEKLLHVQGLVGVLKSLHDDLDAAVLQAYGWGDLNLPTDTESLLERLVALNARRAAEEAGGTVRWLRPDFQKHRNAQVDLSDIVADGEVVGDTDEGINVSAPNPIAVRPWPAGLTEQIKAVAEVITQSGRALELDEVAAYFSGRGRWRERLPTLLDTLVALGRLYQDAAGRWIDMTR